MVESGGPFGAHTSKKKNSGAAKNKKRAKTKNADYVCGEMFGQLMGESIDILLKNRLINGMYCLPCLSG